jgi:hypothetical protein
VAWVHVTEEPGRGLGPALVWAERHGVGSEPDDVVHVVVDEDADVLARRAALFAQPRIEVWRIDGTDLVAVEADADPPSPTTGVEGPAELVQMLVDAGTEVVVEGGVVRGEVKGLEVARVVEGESTAGVPLDEPLLEVGVGAADRELTALVHGELAPREQLGRVVEIVRSHRRPGAERHPLNQLVPERWLRAVLGRHPEVIGLEGVEPAEAAVPRPNLSDRDIAVAVGRPGPVVVACSVGIDLDLVPAAADSREAIDPAAELWLVVPARDDHPRVRRLAGRLRRPARVVTVADDWPSLDT